MKLLTKCKDGGPNSNVDAYVLIEIKSLFSIIVLKFNKGHREAFHNHAFNAITLPFCSEGSLYEEYPATDKVLFYKRLKLKYTPKRLMHRVVALKDSWALTLRGPWDDTWKEQTASGDITIFGWGRQVVQ